MSTAVEPLVATIANSFALHQGRPRLDDNAFAGFVADVRHLPPPERDKAGVELIALAQRAWDTDDDAWDEAILQLCWLVGAALGDLGRAASAVGVDPAAARALTAKALGTTTSSLPVGGPRGPGVGSPLFARARATLRTPTPDGGPEDEP